MAAFTIRHMDQNKKILREETVFMKGISAAKLSATALSPLETESIEIRDLTDNIVAKKQEGIWVHLGSQKKTGRHAFDVRYLNVNREVIHQETAIVANTLHTMKIIAMNSAPEEMAYIEIRVGGTDTVLATRRAIYGLRQQLTFNAIH